MMLAGVGVREGSENRESAHKVIAWLLSEPAQTYLAQEVFEYPVRAGVPTHPDVPPLSGISLFEVSQDALTDLAPTRALLRELGLL